MILFVITKSALPDMMKIGDCMFSLNELSSPIAANFCPTFFWLRFSFLMLFFLLISICKLDNDV